MDLYEAGYTGKTMEPFTVNPRRPGSSSRTEMREHPARNTERSSRKRHRESSVKRWRKISLPHEPPVARETDEAVEGGCYDAQVWTDALGLGQVLSLNTTQSSPGADRLYANVLTPLTGT